MQTFVEQVTARNPVLGELLGRLEYEILKTPSGSYRNSLTVIRDYIAMYAMAEMEDDGVLIPLVDAE